MAQEEEEKKAVSCASLNLNQPPKKRVSFRIIEKEP